MCKLVKNVPFFPNTYQRVMEKARDEGNKALTWYSSQRRWSVRWWWSHCADQTPDLSLPIRHEDK